MFIFRSILISKKAGVILFTIWFFIIGSGCASNVHDSFALYDGYVVTLPEGSTSNDIHWAKYLYSHLYKRSMKSSIIAYVSGGKNFYQLQVRINHKMEKDFQIECEKGKVLLAAQDDQKMLWLIYQLIKTIGGEDERIDVSDLPPAVIEIKDTIGVFPFEYREAYYPENSDPDFSAILGMNNVNFDWGLWGHHLSQAIGKNPDLSVFATVKGEKYENQYCFSAEETYKRIESYIINNYGDGKAKSYRFAIFPNDDDCVCMCAACKALGNTPTNATPAVTRLIVRLAKRFPAHQFFTSSYLSTATPPLQPLPVNVGVIVSTMNYPLKSGINQKRRKFTDLIERWQKVTPRIYVWDYVNNFDDYFTPFPMLKIEKERLMYFCDLGIKGVFLNGSGNDYSSFSDLHNYVLSALLINPYLSVDKLVHKYFLQYYPSSAATMEKYYLAMENNTVESHKEMNLYGGIQEAIDSYLQLSVFLPFYKDLDRCLNTAKDDERKKLNQLLVALTFTRLELARVLPDAVSGCLGTYNSQIAIKPEILMLVNRLADYKDFINMKSYRESDGEIDKYISDWRKYILPAQFNNLLNGKEPRALTPLDKGYEDVRILTDGIHGLPSNYHSGWLISSVGTALELSIPIKTVRKTKIFRISFLHCPRFHLFIPQQVELLKNGKIYKTYNPVVSDSNMPYQMIEIGGEVNLSDATSLIVRLVRANGKRKNIACDEIQLNP